MEQIIQISPAFDKRHSNPNQNYDIHGVDFRFILKGKHGATQFVLYSNWHLPHVTQEHDSKVLHDAADCTLNRILLSVLYHPMPVDLGYHSCVPQYDGQTSMTCDLLPEGKCYYDGSSLNAEAVYTRMLIEGGDGVWDALKQYYIKIFGEEA